MHKQIPEQMVEGLVLPILSDHAFELVDIEYKKEGSHWYLRIFIDKPGGITLDDCQAVSEALSRLLDDTDPIPQSYFLEVSSPGLDRVLKKEKDFVRHAGQKVDISLYKPIQGKKKHSGELIGIVGEEIHIRDKNGTIAFRRTDVSQVRLSVEF